MRTDEVASANNDKAEPRTVLSGIGARAQVRGSSSCTSILFCFRVLISSGDTGLWATDGTGAGTWELPVSGGYSGGIAPNGFSAVFGSDVLFGGYDSSAHRNLWVTNGTAAGTSELTVAGAYSGGLVPSNFAVFGNEVLFNGLDAAGHGGLWVTNWDWRRDLGIDRCGRLREWPKSNGPHRLRQ